MTKGKELRTYIKDSGVSISFLAEKMDCSRNRIYAILDGSDCTASEIEALSRLLKMTREQRDFFFFE